jgi:hypothetical protein
MLIEMPRDGNGEWVGARGGNVPLPLCPCPVINGCIRACAVVILISFVHSFSYLFNMSVDKYWNKSDNVAITAARAIRKY